MLASGVETTIEPGDFFESPPGHDTLIGGDDQVELILFALPNHPHKVVAPQTSQISFSTQLPPCNVLLLRLES